MRFVLAIVSFVVAIAAIGYGVAQRTVLAQPDEITTSIAVSGNAPVTVVDGKTLNAFDGNQTLMVEGSNGVFAAYGRTIDVLGWVGEAKHNRISWDAEQQELVSETAAGEETEVPDPMGSDLWIGDYLQEEQLTITVNVPDSTSFMLVSDGAAPAPRNISLTWPVDNSTPWSGPLIVGGALLLLVGLGLLLWALAHMRKARGPRRKAPKMPKLPKPPKYKPVKRGKPKAVESSGSGRRSSARGMTAVVPVLLVGTLALGSCSAENWPQFGGDETPTPTPTSAAELDVDVEPPAATVRQVERIIERVSAVAVEADAARDAELLATRFAGPALELRSVNYTIRGKDPEIGGLPAIPPGPLEVILPQAKEGWPRTIFTVIEDPEDETVAPTALFLIQEHARADYKVHYAMTFEPSAVLPDMAPPELGTYRLPDETGLLALAPSQVAAAYGDILLKDTESEFYGLFEAEGDSLRAAVGVEAKAAERAELPDTASIAWSIAEGTGQTIPLATNDAGALVAVSLKEITTVKPDEAGAAVNPSGAVKALSDVSISTKGVTATYADQLLFYVPSATSGDKIVLLGFSQGLIAATEIE